MNFKLFTDYFQFYIQDESAEGNLSDSWDEQAVTRLLAVASGTVGIGTVRNVDVEVSVEILSKEIRPELKDCDHAVECTIEVKSHALVIAGCTDYFPDAKRIPVIPGTYRLLASYFGLNTVSSDGLDGNDRYKLQLWPAAYVEPRVLKQRAV
jgi:hypothetical protein